MRRAAVLACLALSGWALTAGQTARSSDAFDYYVMALSWNASWCEAEGDQRRAPQCDPRHDHGWLLHGLWPQYEDGGWPQFCRTARRDPSKLETGAMADIMGSQGLAWHQWKKHGRCTGLAHEDYFDRARAAYEAVERPGLLRKLEKDVNIRADVIEDAFLEANPQLSPEDMIVTCKGGRIQEVRICLTRELEPRPCGPDVTRGTCTRNAWLPMMR